ncbi:MAG: rnd [Bryobacterales bacterium]|nr:rnd [Bryobacterales bacterium]
MTSGVQPQPLFIDEPHALRQYCQTLQAESLVAIDTEFISELSYTSRLELVQITTRTGPIAVIDYGTIGRCDDDPLAPILCDPAVLKILHAAKEDLIVLAPIAGQPLTGIWDTQLATKLFDYDSGTSYGAVVEGLLGESVAGGQSLSDWAKRPLTSQQLKYAAEDVRYLIPLYDAERGILEKLGRLSWAAEEFEQLTADASQLMAARADENTLYSNVRGAQGMDRRGLAILRELAILRDREARAENRPARSLLKDEVLVQIARRAPRHARDFGEFRSINSRYLEKIGPQLLQAVERGKRISDEELPPALASNPRLTDDEAALTSLLSAVLQQLARKHGVSSTLIATVGDLQRLVENHLRGRHEPSPVLTGWRGQLVGRELLATLNGNAAVRWSPTEGSIVLEEAG